MLGVVGAPPIDQAEYQFDGAVLHLDSHPARPPGVGMDVDVGEGLVDAGEEAGGLEIAKAGVAGPLFSQGTQAVKAGRGELDLERGFGGGGSRVHAVSR